MARIAFIMDRIFRKFGLSGKSFIPMLIGSGCGVPGIMASRTIENDRDRKMTIMTTTFIPCGAKLPFYRHGSRCYLRRRSMGCSFRILPGNCSNHLFRYYPEEDQDLRGRSCSFRYGASCLPLAYRWYGTAQYVGAWSVLHQEGRYHHPAFHHRCMVYYLLRIHRGRLPYALAEDEIDMSILGKIGQCLAWIFIPQGFGNWQATVASITGLVAKENIVGTMGILYSAGEGSVYANMAATFTVASGYAFLAFNLLCAPCFAAMGAIKREMNNTRWFWIAIGYQCGLAYVVSLCVYQIGTLITTGAFGIGTVVAFLLIIGFIYLLFRPYKESTTLKVDTEKAA